MSEVNGNIKRTERPDSVIKTNVAPLTAEVKAKVATAFQFVVNKVKEKHLSQEIPLVLESMVELSCFFNLKSKMKYTVDRVLTEEECVEVLQICMKDGEKFYYTEKEANSWDCRRIYNQEFKNYILQKLKIIHDLDILSIRDVVISLTRYYDNRRLDLHLDRNSNYTTVIPLTDSYTDGRFVLSEVYCPLVNAETKISLGKGEGITFEGNRIYHGVMPVHNGIRSALNIWIDGVNKNKLL